MARTEARPAGIAPPPAASPEAAAESHFIPFSRAEVIRMLIEDGRLPASERAGFREFAEILSALLHHENHRRLEVLKETFASLGPPDPSAPPRRRPSAEERARDEEKFLDLLAEVLAGANYVELRRAEIERSIAADTGLGIRIEVDLDAYARVHVFRRKRCPRKVKVRSFLRTRESDASFFDRVVLYLRFKDGAGVAGAPDEEGAPEGAGPSAGAHLKLFGRVPVDKLEMLFPTAQMRMRLIDKLLIGVPAAASFIVVLATKLGPTVLLVGAAVAFWLGLTREEVTLSQQHLVGLGLGLVTVGAYLLRQLGKVKACRIGYLRQLSENLFYRVLDNNVGVLHHMIGEAEDEDLKEALLAYRFLLTAGGPKGEEEIDGEIEAWLAAAGATGFDFEVDDAARNLERLGLAARDAGGRLTVLPLAAARERLDRLWDDLFRYHEGNTEERR